MRCVLVRSKLPIQLCRQLHGAVNPFVELLNDPDLNRLVHLRVSAVKRVCGGNRFIYVMRQCDSTTGKGTTGEMQAGNLNAGLFSVVTIQRCEVWVRRSSNNGSIINYCRCLVVGDIHRYTGK